jgi:benzoyl-CoA reductase/2-hydroxyglutaryl-CoA dehydratase subunit BcrC/BadD/HgdB
MFEHETDSNKEKRYGFLNIGAGLVSTEELAAFSKGLEALSEYMDDLIKAIEENHKPVIAHIMAAPADIFFAFDAIPIYVSMFTRITNYKGMNCSSYFSQTAEKIGIPEDLCALTKICIGAYHLNQLPRLSAVVGASSPCDSTKSYSQLMTHFSDVPVFDINTPYIKDVKTIKQYAANTWDLIRFLEKTLKRKIDWDKLRNILLEYNKFNYYLKEITEMHRAIPSPKMAVALQFAFGNRFLTPANPKAIKMVEELYEIAKKRVKQGGKKEKIRVMIWDLPIAFMEFATWMEKEFGAIIVSDYLTGIVNPEIDTSSEESMVEGITLDKLLNGMGRQSQGPVEVITDEVEQNIEIYSPDCIIIPGNNACKYNKAVEKILRDTIKKYRIPALFMNLDTWDNRHNSEDEIKRQIREFFISKGLAQ